MEGEEGGGEVDRERWVRIPYSGECVQGIAGNANRG